MPALPKRCERQSEQAAAEGDIIIEQVTDLRQAKLNVCFLGTQAETELRLEQQIVRGLPENQRRDAQREGRIGVLTVHVSDDSATAQRKIGQPGQQRVNLNPRFGSQFSK